MMHTEAVKLHYESCKHALRMRLETFKCVLIVGAHRENLLRTLNTEAIEDCSSTVLAGGMPTTMNSPPRWAACALPTGVQ